MLQNINSKFLEICQPKKVGNENILVTNEVLLCHCPRNRGGWGVYFCLRCTRMLYWLKQKPVLVLLLRCLFLSSSLLKYKHTFRPSI